MPATVEMQLRSSPVGFDSREKSHLVTVGKFTRPRACCQFLARAPNIFKKSSAFPVLEGLLASASLPWG